MPGRAKIRQFADELLQSGQGCTQLCRAGDAISFCIDFSSQHCLAWQPKVAGVLPSCEERGVRASCQVIWIIFPTSAKFTYQICNFACGYRCGCSCSWSRAKVAGIYIQLYVCLSPLPSPTAAACLAAAKDAFRACFWLDSDSTWMKMFARIRGINKCTPCASQFMYVCVVVCVSGVCACAPWQVVVFVLALNAFQKRSHACEPQFELWTWEN